MWSFCGYIIYLIFYKHSTFRTHLEAILAHRSTDVCVALFHLEAPGIGPADHVLPPVAVDIVGSTHGLLDFVSCARIYAPADESVAGALLGRELSAGAITVRYVATSLSLVDGQDVG